jgi:hypothetical protein
MLFIEVHQDKGNVTHLFNLNTIRLSEEFNIISTQKNCYIVYEGKRFLLDESLEEVKGLINNILHTMYLDKGYYNEYGKANFMGEAYYDNR